jgi:glycosyltransferase involved in cell wall biosynthesis
MGFNNPFKGMAYIVKVMLELAATDIEFIVVGKCRLTDFPKELHQKLHLMGLIKKQEEMVSLYSAADALMITSLAENFPNVVIEAMSCGIPVVGFATGGIKDQIIHKKNGWLTEPKNIGGLVEGVKWVIDNNYQELSNTARQSVVNRYSYHRALDIHKPLLDLAR